MTNPKVDQFFAECAQRAAGYPGAPIAEAATRFMKESTVPKYSYNFTWLGRPIIQYPQDMVAVQEVIWDVRPNLIIETGIAHGGSLIMSASLLAMLEYCDAAAAGTSVDPANPKGKVLAIDIDIREHNREAIEAHPMAGRIEMLQGSSTDENIVAKVHQIAEGFQRVLVCLDSNHTHEHVLAELEAYAPLVSSGSYCIVFDTIVDDVPADLYPDRPWGPGNSPKSAVHEFLKTHSEFSIQSNIDNKLLISVAPQGYLKRD
ncbi:MAG: cephalosporin hydroxylase family protein [Planctomycetota bacterium]